MALMTSSSVTSSAVPRKLVSRRSIRMARSLSALPRKALTSCRRSRSLRGRKSMAYSFLRKKRTRDLDSGPGRQLGRQQEHGPVHRLLAGIDLEQVAGPFDVITDLLRPHQHTDRAP